MTHSEWLGDVLIIDDQADNLNVLSTMLRMKGYRPRPAISGPTGLTAARKVAPDVILLDIMMPEMDGYEVCRRLKADPRTRDVPVIFLSGITQMRDRLRAFEAGGVDYITKPFTGAEVVARVKAQTRIRRQQLEIQRLLAQERTRIEALNHEIEQRQHAETALFDTNRRLSLLNRLISLADAAMNVSDLLQTVNREFMAAFGAVCSQAFTVDEADRGVTIKSQQPADDWLQPPGTWLNLADSAIFQYVAAYRIPLTITDLNVETQYRFPGLLTERDDVCAVVAVPLIGRGQLIGLILFGLTDAHAFSQNEMDLIAEAGQAVSQSLENSRMSEALTAHNLSLGKLVAERTAQLDRLNQRMAAVLASVTDSIILTEADGSIIQTNLGFDTQFGYPSDALFDYPLQTIVKPDYASVLQSTFHVVLQTGKTQTLQVEAQRKDGSLFDADIALARVGDGEHHIVCSCHDITSHKENERIKDNFISMVTHELRTPITAITLLAGAIRRYYDRMSDDMRLQKLAQLDQQAQIMAELVESVLDISRLEARGQPGAQQHVNMTEIAQRVIDELADDARRKHHQVTLRSSSELSLIAGDKVDFARIWRNLLNNAIKYTQEGGCIQLRVGSVRIGANGGSLPDELPAEQLTAGHYIVGQVQDNGHGISPEDQQQLFERFQRGWAKQSPIPGTGLGLALVRELLMLYGGDIVVNSQIDKGTTFTFWLPLQDNNSTAI